MIFSSLNKLKFLIFCIVPVLMISCGQDIEDKSGDTVLSEGWHLQSSEKTEASGETISTPDFDAGAWFKTDVPTTVLAALVENEVYTDIFKGTNFDNIPEEPFLVPWWFRRSFEVDEKDPDAFYNLLFEGINYRANIWLNGRKLADSDTIETAYRRFQLDITKEVSKGNNVLAVEIIPPGRTDLTIGFVDWNPWPPDKNMGIWRPVKLIRTGPLSLNNIFVKPDLETETLDEASLTITADVKNHTDRNISGEVNCRLEGLDLTQPVELAPGEIKSITFEPSEYAELKIKSPRIWWPNNLGAQELYTLEMGVYTGLNRSDFDTVRFGIRKVEEFVNEDGHKGFKINGKKLLIKGGGWTDDIMLDDTDEKVKAQIEYVKHMNLNTIRLEGFWGRNSKIFDYADENGILIMIGWSCQWEWEGYSGRPEDEFMAIRTDDEMALHSRGYRDQVLWLRNHPSIFLWVYGSDKLLLPELERRMNEMLLSEDPTRPILNSCGSAVSSVTGASGVKMAGPYAYVTPNYWYEDTTHGGAFGFNTETGPGIQPSPLESVKRMIPENHLWPIDSVWEYHLGRNEFRTFKYWMPAFRNRYGMPDNVEDFTYKAQMSNYEAVRPMFEAFEVNKYKSTGVIQWMLNSAWPGMLWQLYDWYLMPNGAFYGTRNACEPVNIVYNYKDGNIYLTNDLYESIDGLTAEVRVLDSDSRILFDRVVETSIDANTSTLVLDMPALENLTRTYFLDLKLVDQDKNVISDNFYWLSTEEDILDFENTQWFVTPNRSYADLKGINNLPRAEIEVSHEFYDEGDKKNIEVTLNNSSDKLAFFIYLDVEGSRSGMSVLPVFWEDNYISILPGESKKITGAFYKNDLQEEDPVFTYKGWNLKE